MRPIYERCCGLDVHKKTVVACRITPEDTQTRTFGTMTDELVRLREWLLAAGVTHVAMESSGVYWKPVYNLLEDQGMELLVVNARHVKAVPGRKTDVKDAEWLAELLQHGLLKASFIPDRESRERRELVRYRRSLVEQRAHLIQRMQKLLEGANIKLGDVASDVMGVSGRAMLQALAEGVDDPAAVAGLAKNALRHKIPELERALTGTVRHSRKPSFFTARYRRLAARRGKKRAAVAIAHSLLIAIYHVLKDGVVFQDLGPAHFEQRNRDAIVRRSLRRLEGLGYKVTVEPMTA